MLKLFEWVHVISVLLVLVVEMNKGPGRNKKEGMR